MLPILVSSCDNYLDIAEVSALSFNKFAPVLCNQVNYICEGINIKKKRINKIKSLGFNVIKCGVLKWPEVLDTALNSFEDDSHVVLLLDDFLIKEPINVNAFNQLCIWAKSNDYDYLRLIPRPNNFKDSSYIKEFKSLKIQIKEIEINSRFSINLQAAIWKKTFLKKILQETRDPWEFEIFASSKMSDKLKIASSSEDVFHYRHHSLEKGSWFPWELKRVNLIFPKFYNQRNKLPLFKLFFWYLSIIKGLIAYKLDNSNS